MRRLIMISLCMFLLSSCSSSKSSWRRVNDQIHGVIFLIEHQSGPALSRSYDFVYLERPNGKEKVFEGYGSNGVDLIPIRKGVILVKYCDGSIRSINPFILTSKTDGLSTLVQLQPIMTRDVRVSNRSFC